MSAEELERTQLVGELQRANSKLVESQKFMLTLLAQIVAQAGGEIVISPQAQQATSLGFLPNIITTHDPETGSIRVTVRKTPKPA